MQRLLTTVFVFLFSVLLINAQQRAYYSSMDVRSQQPKISTPNDTLSYINPANGSIYNAGAGKGMVFGPNIYGDLGKYQRFDLTQGLLLKGYIFYTYVKAIKDTPDTVNFVVKTANANGSPGATIATLTKTTNQLTANGWTILTMPANLPVGKSFFIGYEWASTANDTFGLASDKGGLGYGDGAKRVWEKSSDGSYGDVQTDWTLDVDLYIYAIGEKILPISEARIDANADLIPDRNLDTLTVSGVVFTPNYQTSNRSYYIWDGTAGICTYRSGLTSPALALGDSVVLRGQIQQYNGLTEIVPFADTLIWVVGNNAKLPNPIILYPGQFKANPEQYEGKLVQITSLSKVSGTWPAAGSSATINLTNYQDTVAMRIDSDTDIDGTTEPVWPRDVLGVITQFSATSVSAGYQLQPRYAATDFVSATPVELSSLSASVSGKSVILSWSTVTEKNNMGFEIQRSSDKVSFSKVGYINGNGTTTESKNYSFTDNNVTSSKNYYRLKQMDYDGTFKYSSVIEAEIGAIASYSLDQNYPNPFNPSTQIKYTLASNSNVKIVISNALGETVKEITNEFQQAGVHVMNFNASGFSSGVYFYTINASSVDGQNFSASKKMILMK